VLTLGRENGFVGENLFAFDQKDYISELGVIDYFSHILDKTIHRFVIYFVFF
jgi:hypothetical protein